MSPRTPPKFAVRSRDLNTEGAETSSRLARSPGRPPAAPPKKLAPIALLAFAFTSFGCAPVWKNYLGELEVRAIRKEPESVSEVLALVASAAKNGQRLRAVGSGHSSAEVAKPVEDELYLDIDRLDQILEYNYLRVPDPRYVRIGAGAKIREINALLAARGRALYNMGNYDAQTIAGAFSTGTHGSGLNHGPLTDRIVALELVTDEIDPKTKARVQRLLRLEPTNGISDGAAFVDRTRGPISEDPFGDMVLEQNDDAFNAALLAFGNFGVIVSVTVDTREAFWLEEQDEMFSWDTAAPPPVESWAHEHPEFLQLTLMPHRMLSTEHKGEVLYMKTTRREVNSCGEVPARRPPSRETLGRFLGLTLGTGFLETRGLVAPKSTLELLFAAFRERSGKRFSSRSDFVLINSLAPHITATSVDIWVPLSKASAAINRIIQRADEFGTVAPGPVDQEWWHTSPLGLRFVNTSKALLSPSYDGPRMSIEIPLLVDTRRHPGDEAEYELHQIYRERMLSRLSEELTSDEFHGRPHFGQKNYLSYALMEKFYGENFRKWLQFYRRFNAFETFSNEFSDRLCLSHQAPARCGNVTSTAP